MNPNPNFTVLIVEGNTVINLAGPGIVEGVSRQMTQIKTVVVSGLRMRRRQNQLLGLVLKLNRKRFGPHTALQSTGLMRIQ
jgi:hypothetical protein